jgi:transcriptional regulator with XRE-family HTH domain
MAEQTQPEIGTKVKALRQQRGLSLRALAELCGLSANTISLIERGVSSPSVATLHQLATALGISIGAFFEETDSQSSIILIRSDRRSRSGSASILLESLGAGLTDQSLEPFVVTLKPGASAGKPTMAHTGHEFVFVLEGDLQYEIADQTYHLTGGDSLIFEARLPHCWHNNGDVPVKFLLIFQAAAQDSIQQHLHK